MRNLNNNYFNQLWGIVSHTVVNLFLGMLTAESTINPIDRSMSHSKQKDLYSLVDWMNDRFRFLISKIECYFIL